MIVAANDNNISVISDLCKGSVLGARIMCLCNCYGFGYDFLKVYLLYNESEELTGVFSSFYGNVTLICNENTDFAELDTFFDINGYTCVTCDAFLVEKINSIKCEIKQVYKFTGNSDYVTASDANENDYKYAYNLISRSIPGSFSDTKEAYFSWLSDFTFRNLRNYARMKCVREDNCVVSCAMTAAECRYSAVISGVACDVAKRKNGAGKSVVLTLANELKNENKDVYVIALNNTAEGFYEHIGFVKCSAVAITER